MLCLVLSPLPADLKQKLQEERATRQKADQQVQEVERQRSMLSVDYNQLQQQHQRIEQEFLSEIDKVLLYIFESIIIQCEKYF